MDTQIAQLEKKVAALNRLLEAASYLNATILSSSVRIEALLTYLMDTAAEITDAAAASVLLWNNNTRELFFAATTTNNPDAQDLLGKPVPLEKSIAGTILRERTTIAVDDAANDPRIYTQVDEDLAFVTRSLLGVPMITKNKVIGVLEVVNKREVPWTEDDKVNLVRLAEEAAVAIEVAQMVVALRKANEELSEVDKLKSDFIAIASHELRTPLGVILGYASFLQEEESTNVSNHASRVMESALQLRRIIEDMVNLRYLKQSPSELKREMVTLSDLLRDLKHDILTLTDLRAHKLEIEQAGEADLYIDRGRTIMALTNILNNAARFTPPGGRITIDARIPNDHEVWISVTDTGIGIAQEHLQVIFEEFYQVEDHMTRKHGGLGIGLSISKALVKAQGGRIWANSAGVNEGTTVTVTLPLSK